jgi:hypothetical protein
MAASGPYRNANLFSGYYLDERVDGLEAWDCEADARATFEELRGLWAEEVRLVASYGEDELLDAWIDEVLSTIEFDTLSETTLSDRNGHISRLLFESVG